MDIGRYIGSLEDIATPVIILDKDGKVVYKNSSAVRRIRLPKRNTHIFLHLDKTGLSEYEKIKKRKKPSIITVNTGDRNARAFVSRYKREGEECSIWIFAAHLQANASSRVFNEVENSINLAAYEICEVVKEVDRRSTLLDLRVKGASDKKIGVRFLSLLDRIFASDAINPKACFYRISETADILLSTAEKTLSHFGYSLRTEKENFDKSLGYLINYRGLSSAFTHILLFAAEAAGSRALEIKMSFCDESLEVKIDFTVPIPPCYMQNEKDVSRLAELCPKNMVDVIIFKKICETFGYDFEFTVTEDFIDNVSISFRAPCADVATLRSPGAFDIESILLEKDQTVILAYIFSDEFSEGTFTEEQ